MINLIEGKTIALSLKKASIPILAALLSGILLAGLSAGAGAKEAATNPRSFHDSRYNHNRSYPAKGQFVQAVPQGVRDIYWGKEKYLYFNGVWYRLIGRQFLVVSPPVGVSVPQLPPFHTSFWVNGVPYYYANEVYYTQSTIGYLVAESPKGPVDRNPPGKQLFIYPRQNQEARTREKDLRECQVWARNQTGFDPAKPPAGLSEVQFNQRQDDYQRALGACLEAKGYSVK